MKKLVALLVAVATVASMFVFSIPASAEEVAPVQITEEEYLIIEKLEALGAITNGYDAAEYVKRADMAEIIAHYMKLSVVDTQATKSPFYDVSPKSEYYGAVKALYDLGVITGDGSLNYKPDEYVTYDQALVFVVNAVGHKIFAEREGGYPTGYHRVAIKHGMLKNLSVSKGTDYVKLTDVYRMLEAALTAAAVETSYYGDGDVHYAFSTTETFLSEVYGIRKYRGKVTGNENTRLSNDSSTLTDEQLEIDGVIYDTPGYTYSYLLGYSVDYYLKTNSVTDIDLIYVEETKKMNSVIRIDAEDIDLVKTTSDRIYDGAGIYTLGASSLECDQTDTNRNNKIFGNYIRNSWNCTSIYPDQGSRSWYVKDNVMDQSKVKFIEYNLLSDALTIPWASHMHSTDIKWMTYENNYATCDYGTRNERESNIEPLHLLTPGDYANWPDEAKAIMASAGIEADYRDNFDFASDVYIGSDDRRQSISLETPTFSGIHVQDHEGNEIDLSTVDMELWVDDPEALELTPDGYFVAHKSGLLEAEIAVHAGGKTFLYHYRIECGDDIERLGLNIDYVNIVQGATVSLSAMAYTTFENSIDITAEAEIDLKPDDDIVTVEKVQRGTSLLYDIKIVPLTLDTCETVVRGTIKYGEFVQEVEIPVKIIKYDSEEGATLPYTKVNFATGWMSPGEKTEDGGYKVGGKPNFNTQIFENQLIAFDMQIDAGNSWPGFTICDSDPMSDYTKNDCYMISFKSTFVEVQKFNQGARTVIFGDKIGSARPIGGPGIPNVDGAVLEYGKRYSVVVGALETEEGTRLILNLNGKNIMDFTDGNSNRLAAHGHFATYNPTTSNGGTTYWPYSGITE